MTHFEKWLKDELDIDRADLTEDGEKKYRQLWKLDNDAGEDPPAAPPAAPPTPETETAARKREIQEMAPRGMEGFADELVLRVDDTTKKPITVDQARTELLKKVADDSTPAGSPEPPDPSAAKPDAKRKDGEDKPEKLADVDDEVLTRSVTG